MNLSDLYSANSLKHGLCTVVVVALLAYILPAIIPENDDPDNMLNKINNVFKSVQENPVPILVVVFVGCMVGGALCHNTPGLMTEQ